ncbi:MAG: IS1380 family transposase [Acidimicrobiaceae bacterium]|nr:IS1380 family transposase [Acidimicrobiaceae bacterium]
MIKPCKIREILKKTPNSAFTQWVNSKRLSDFARLMKILPYNTAASCHNFTSRAGLVVPAELLKRLELSQLIDSSMPTPGSNRGYRHSAIFNTFMLMFHEGAGCIDDVRHLRSEPALMKLLGFGTIPCATTLGGWLHRVGDSRQMISVLEQVNRAVMKATLGDRKCVTLDIDASAIRSKKKDAKWTYKKHRGYMPMFGHIAETGQVAAAELREGNVPPGAENVEFFRRCRAALPEGVGVTRFRADAASYQAGIINDCRAHGIRFAIRAKMDSAVKKTVLDIKDEDWNAVVNADGAVLEGEYLARTLHVMEDVPEAFCLVVQKKWVRDKLPADAGMPDGTEQLKMVFKNEGLHQVDVQSAVSGRYIYRAIATDLDLDRFSDGEIVWWYNQRGDSSENRLKEIRSDFSAAHLPCGEFKANVAYLLLSSIAFNLLALMRMKLPQEWYGVRAISFRHRLYAMAGQVVRHARQWTLKVSAAKLPVLEQSLWAIRRCSLS